MGASFCGFISVQAVIFLTPFYLQNALQLPVQQVGLIIAIFGGMMMFLAPIAGWIADRIGGLRTLLLGSSLQCLALFFYIPFDGLVSLYIVSALFGLSQGGIVPSYALIVREYFPAREAGARVSLVLMITIVGMAVGGWMSGEIYDLTGSYRMAFLSGIAWNLLNMSIAFWLLAGRQKSTSATA